MIYERLPDDIKRKDAAVKIACRNMELVAAAGAAGVLAAWYTIRTRYALLGPVIPVALCGTLGTVIVGGALAMRRWPRPALVESIARKLPKSGRKMLSRASVALMAVAALIFASVLGHFIQDPETARAQPPSVVPSTLPELLARPTVERTAAPASFRFGWTTGLHLRVTYVSSESSEGGTGPQSFSARGQFDVSADQHADGIKISLANFVPQPSESTSDELRTKHLRELATWMAAPSWLVGQDGRFMRVLDRAHAVERARTAIRKYPLEGASSSTNEQLAAGLSDEWLSTLCREVWSSWVEGVLRKSPISRTEEQATVGLSFLNVAVPARQSFELLGTRACAGSTTCYVIESVILPDAKRAAEHLQEALPRARRGVTAESCVSEKRLFSLSRLPRSDGSTPSGRGSHRLGRPPLRRPGLAPRYSCSVIRSDNMDDSYDRVETARASCRAQRPRPQTQGPRLAITTRFHPKRSGVRFSTGTSRRRKPLRRSRRLLVTPAPDVEVTILGRRRCAR